MMKMKNSGKKPEKSSLERKLNIPFSLSVWWYIAAVFLLFFGIYALGMFYLTKYVQAQGGTWHLFTTKRPHLTPFSSYRDVRWGTFYIPVKAVLVYYRFAALSVIGAIMLMIRRLSFNLFLKKFQSRV
jgi:hypothetical protein